MLSSLSAYVRDKTFATNTASLSKNKLQAFGTGLGQMAATGVPMTPRTHIKQSALRFIARALGVMRERDAFQDGEGTIGSVERRKRGDEAI